MANFVKPRSVPDFSGMHIDLDSVTHFYRGYSKNDILFEIYVKGDAKNPITFLFEDDAEQEAQELYDKLRGKKGDISNNATDEEDIDSFFSKFFLKVDIYAWIHNINIDNLSPQELIKLMHEAQTFYEDLNTTNP